MQLKKKWLKSQYLEKLKQKVLSTGKENDQSTDEPINIEAVEFKERGRPLLLGAELDATVQEYICTILLVDQ